MAAVLAACWLPVQATVMPSLGLAWLPFDPILPLVAAFALAGRSGESWALAVGLGLLADFFSGTGSGRLVLQYALVVGLAAPLHGRVVLRDRWFPSVGVAALTALADLLLLVILGALGAAGPSDGRPIPREALGGFLASAALWPAYRRAALGHDDRHVSLGRGR
jgi:rod shape-determining protein MreD